MKSSSAPSALSMIEEIFPPMVGQSCRRMASFSMVSGRDMSARRVIEGEEGEKGALGIGVEGWIFNRPQADKSGAVVNAV